MNTMSIYETIVIGIVTGIITSALIWLIVTVFNNILIPWYQKIIYRGIDLDGNWFGEELINSRDENFPVKYEYLIMLNQKGHKVNGQLTITNVLKDSKDNYTSEYNFSGEISDNCLLICYQRVRRNKFGMGSFLLNITDAGDMLMGSSIYLTNTSEIGSTNNISMKRKNN